MFRERIQYVPVKELGKNGEHAPQVIFDLRTLPEQQDLAVDLQGVRRLMRAARIGQLEVVGYRDNKRLSVVRRNVVGEMRPYEDTFPAQGRRLHVSTKFSLLTMEQEIEADKQDVTSPEVWANKIDVYLKNKLVDVGTQNLVGRLDSVGERNLYEQTKFAITTALGAGTSSSAALVGDLLGEVSPAWAGLITLTGIALTHGGVQLTDWMEFRRFRQPGERFAPTLFAGSQPDKAVSLGLRAQFGRPLVTALAA